MSSEMLLIFIKLEKAELEVKMFVFVISLVGTLIPDGSTEEKSN